MSTGQDQIAAFIAESNKRVDVSGRFKRLVLVHIVRGHKLGDEIRTVSVPDSIDDEWITSTAKRLYDTAGEEATALAAGLQRYAVSAYFEDADRAQGRIIIAISGDDQDDDSVATEGPTGEGLVAQAMRHTEFFAREASRGAISQIREMRTEMVALRAENAALRKEKYESFKIMEDVYSAAGERAITARREEAKTKALEAGADKLMLLAPYLLNHWAGKKILPEQGTALLMWQSLANSISRDQFEAMKGILNPDQVAVMVQSMMAVSKLSEDKKPEANGVASNGAMVHKPFSERLLDLAGGVLT